MSGHLPDPARNAYIAKWYPGRDVIEAARGFGFYVTMRCGLWTPKLGPADGTPCETCHSTVEAKRGAT